jgi:toxin ParE1/3/4
MVPEVSDPAIRETFLHSYRILYRVHQGHVLILAVIHGARDFERWRRDRE